MTQTSNRIRLPLLASGQAQKEITHNEALVLADIAMQAVVESGPLATPPTSPIAGKCWIVAPGATGSWAGRDGCIAGWTEGGWRFLEPFEGLSAWCVADNQIIRYGTSDWISGEILGSCLKVAGVQVVASQQDAISAPSGGATIDAQARVAVNAILTVLTAHGLIAT